jgi:ribose transport system permease protein
MNTGSTQVPTAPGRPDVAGAATGPDTSLAPGAPARVERRAAGSWTVYVLLAVILAWIWWLDRDFVQGTTLMAFAKVSAPFMVLAAGQYFVIVNGEFDLSVGSLVGAQVVIAAQLLDGEDSRTYWVIAVMVGFGLLVGLVNGLITTVLKVPSFITTLGMMMVLFGAVRLWTGGAPTGELSERFRILGRSGVEMPGVRVLRWSVLAAVAVGVVGVLIMRSSFGRTLIAAGDNPRAARFSAVAVDRTKVVAFVLSSLAATLAAIIIGGDAGLTSRVGDGLEFEAITAVVLGGVVLGGGRGSVIAAMAGALTLQAVFRLFRQFDWATTWEPTVQGVIIIAAVAYASWRPEFAGGLFRPRPPAHRPTASTTTTTTTTATADVPPNHTSARSGGE